MSTVDTSTWSPDSDLNVDIGGIPLNADAGIAQTWKVIAILMAAVKGDGDAIKSMIDVMQGATASADGASGLAPQPLAGEQDRFLKGDGTWGSIPAPNLGTASRAVQTDANGDIAVSSVTTTELGYLSGVTSALQTQIDAKAADNTVLKLASANAVSATDFIHGTSNSSYFNISAGSADKAGAYLTLRGPSASSAGYFGLHAKNTTSDVSLVGRPNGSLLWNGNEVQTSSDERLKTPLTSVPDEVLDAWEDVGWGQFQFLASVSEKGGAARLHLGLIAQRVEAVFKERGLDACEYGILCYEEGDDLWMVRYAEAFAMEAACQRRRADRLEARIKALEEKTA